MKKFQTLLTTIVTLISLVAMSQATLAQVVPYKTHGSGGIFVPATGNYYGLGVGAPMGKHFFCGFVEQTPTGPLTVDIVSTQDQVTIAANGDELYFSLAGTVEFIPLNDDFTLFTAVWDVDFTVTGGTGRFANVKPANEPVKAFAMNDPFAFTDAETTFFWELDGKIDLGKRRRK